jgi:hypothetical protein
MHYARVDRRALLKLLLAGGAGLAVGLNPSRLVSAVSSAEREAHAAVLGQELFDDQMFRFSKDWLELCSCHCTADHLHAGIDFETPDGSPVRALTSGFALDVKIGLGAVTVLTNDFGYGCGFNRGVTIVYFHLKNIQINIGEYVARGAHLGNVMNIGARKGPRSSTSRSGKASKSNRRAVMTVRCSLAVPPVPAVPIRPTSCLTPWSTWSNAR